MTSAATLRSTRGPAVSRRLFPKPIKETDPPFDPEAARPVRSECAPWCSSAGTGYSHVECESLSFTGSFSAKAYDSRRRARRVAVALSSWHTNGVFSKKVIDRHADSTWVHLETTYVVNREERVFHLYLPSGEALRLAAAVQSAGLAADGLDETITQRVRDWREWTGRAQRMRASASA
jgi:hypothetical protein